MLGDHPFGSSSGMQIALWVYRKPGCLLADLHHADALRLGHLDHSTYLQVPDF